MAMTAQQSVVTILIIAAATFLIRGIPFILFPGHKKTPEYVTYLSNVLPAAIIGMLVIYCMKGASFASFPYAIPEIISITVVVMIHLWKRNTLLSIGGGTIIYMLLVQFVFQ